MRVRELLLVCLVASPLAGCLGGPVDRSDAAAARLHGHAPGLPMAPGAGLDTSKLTQPVYEALPKTVHYVLAAVDRIHLYAEAFLPKGAGPWPTILINSPYYDHGVNGATDVEGPFRDYYVRRGYAVVVADVRGTGYSEGCMDMMGAKEQRDTYDLVEWIANQSWSNGKVGMYGVSYVGTTPHEALIMAPPHLVTVVTVAGVTNQWRNMYQNGVPYQGRFYPLTYEALEGAPPPGDAARGADWALNVAAAACDQQEMVRHVTPPTYGRGVYDGYWKERNFTLHAGNAKASLFYNQGFIDRAVNPMESIYWFNELPVVKKAFFGQWPHQTPPRKDWQNASNAWFDYWLKDIQNGIMDTPTVEVITNDNRVRTDERWPPSGTVPMRLYLQPDALSATPPAQSLSATYVADNGNPSNLGPDPRVPLVTSLSFASEPLAQETYMAGIPWAHLVASSDQSNTYFLLELYDVDGATWRPVQEAWMNAHLWKSFDASSPLTPGAEYRFDFKFEPREYVFAPGHRVGLTISGHDSRVLPSDQPIARNTIKYGPLGSSIELPILRDARPVERPGDI